MTRFILRHWTGIAIVIAIAVWAVFYLPNTPSFAVFELKQAIDARNADEAARFVDFDSVVKNAGNEMASDNSGPRDIFSQMLRQGAIAMFEKPAAQAIESWARHEVETGAHEVQMPAAAVAGAMLLLHRNGDSAYTKFRDHKGQVWEIEMARNSDGQWQVVEVKNIRQLLEKLQSEEQKRLSAP
jgi:hypothetical protein